MTFNAAEHFAAMGGLLKVYQAYAPADALALWSLSLDGTAEASDKYLELIGEAKKRDEIPAASASDDTSLKIKCPCRYHNEHREYWEEFTGYQQHTLVGEWDYLTRYLAKFPNKTDKIRLEVLHNFLLVSTHADL